ncbi:hypothetical protein [uncultured Rubinisphaera sp.]|uniref:hypothetical protein n=1 Tax=uncultured Rubinisphaera sp. TaxID=1678686 RepID=UPI0030DA53D3|tara:strand:+ start:348 stop:725 length:378 start_codon:yes stop_codon:yes gene_type:complete
MIDETEIPAHRQQFVDELAQTIAEPYSEFDSLPNNEYIIRFKHAYSRDIHTILISYITNNPDEDLKILTAMRKLDEVTVEEYEFHVRLIEEERFEYTESEGIFAKEIREKSAILLGEVGGIMFPE